MDSSGVLLPESSIIGTATSMNSRPSRGIDRAIVARKMPMALAKNEQRPRADLQRSHQSMKPLPAK